MKKRGSLIISVAGMLFAGAALAGCGQEPGPSVVMKDFTGIAFEGATVTFDGQAHELAVTGAPEGATIVYGEGGNSFTEVGEHVITVTVSMDGYNDYTGSATLTIVKADFQGVAMADKTVNFNGEAQTIEVTGFPEGATVTYTTGKANAVLPGTYTIEAKVSKAGYNDLTLDAQLKINSVEMASSPMMIDDFEGAINSQVSSDWELQKYVGPGWAESSATVKVANNGVFGEGTETMKFGIWNNGTVFKATKELVYDTYKKYTGFSIDTYAQLPSTGKCEIDVQFWFNGVTLYSGDTAISLDGQYITYKLATEVPDKWTHWEIPFNDSTLSITSGAMQPAALAGLGFSVTDLMLLANKVAIIAKTTAVDNGPDLSLFLDNLKLAQVEERLEEQQSPTPSDYTKKFYIWNSGTDHFLMEANDDFSQIRLTRPDGEFYTGTGAIDGTTLSVNAGDGLLTFDVDVTTFKVSNVGGLGAALYTGSLNEKTLKPATNLNLDFEDGAGQGTYNNAAWTQEKYDSGDTEHNQWPSMASSQMNSRKDSSNNKIVNFVSGGYGITRRFTYTPSASLGPINHLKIDLGHYNSASKATTIKYKISFIDGGGNAVYAAGSGDNYATINLDTSKGDFLNHLEFTFNNVCAAKFRIVLNTAESGNSYLYVDNIVADLIKK